MGIIVTKILECLCLYSFRKHHSIKKKNSIEASVDLIEMYLQESDEKTDEMDKKN